MRQRRLVSCGVAPDPALSTLYARPLAVTFASAGGEATSAGAGMEPPAAMARTLPCARPDATMPPTTARRISELAPLAAARSGTKRALVRSVRGCGARSVAQAADGVSSARAAERDGAHTPRLSSETDMTARGGAFFLKVTRRAAPRRTGPRVRVSNRRQAIRSRPHSRALVRACSARQRLQRSRHQVDQSWSTSWARS